MPRPKRYRKKTGTVEAYQTNVLREVATPTGNQIARPRDWIIKYENGNLGIANEKDFLKLYERIDS